MGGKEFIPYNKAKVEAWKVKLADDEKKAAEKAEKDAKKGGKAGKKDAKPKEEKKKEEKPKAPPAKKEEKKTEAPKAAAVSASAAGNAGIDYSYASAPEKILKLLNHCEGVLAKTRYIHGDQPTSLDNDMLADLKPHAANIHAHAYPHTFSWFGVVGRYSDAMRNNFPEVEVAKAAPAKKADDDDDMDLFGDDDDEEAAEAARQAAIDAKAKKSTKKAVIAMSLVMLEVKPLDDTTNLDNLAKKIFAEITQDGLLWKT